MKKLVFTFLILGMVMMVSCNKKAENAYLGTWEVESKDGKTPDGTAVYTFNEDGSAEINLGGDAQTGTFTVSEDGKTITLDATGKKIATNLQCRLLIHLFTFLLNFHSMVFPTAV